MIVQLTSTCRISSGFPVLEIITSIAFLQRKKWHCLRTVVFLFVSPAIELSRIQQRPQLQALQKPWRITWMEILDSSACPVCRVRLLRSCS
ncbi:hypothetical protein GUJ93_ZPchr0006g43695 [Zizania palustris]|uniref:Uncharacterized protein n=1 Tax=Zizania palustris TaxID=103762 RepID=A0A8J5SN27_ZIZPA|nr:hypothetical protein GUJ93_ZPchr0006g43695 [Zizania palustris]